MTRGTPLPLGVQAYKDGINFAYVSATENCGVVLFDRKTKKEFARLPFQRENRVGNVYTMFIKDVEPEKLAYCFYEEGRFLADERGRAFLGGTPYGAVKREQPVKLAVLPPPEYNWGGDRPREIPYEDSIVYCMHVRGFTRHTSSGVKARGTFAGLAEKLPYLKELGITTLELQPVYEFDEVEAHRLDNPFGDTDKAIPGRKNYWGYTEGCYYSPKSAYAYSKDAVTEFKDLVKSIHQNGMELILQFYFTNRVTDAERLAILRYWVLEYHVDGFHLKGENIRQDIPAQDPVLARTKLWYYGFHTEMQTDGNTSGQERFLAEYRDAYRYDMRRFLKGDEGMLQSVLQHMRRNPAKCGQINFLTNYDGFTLMDLVSYERKHNEDNGENNQDGNDYNASWNCGQEGPARKKAILQLRMKQIKNALLLLFLSQGTPLLFMGDEFGNSQRGNNNPYCQDNDITWLNWKNLESGREIYTFVKELIALRKEHPVLHQSRELRLMDYGACGYPDVSYHGEAPWKPDTSVYSRQVGIMYCGKYAQKDRNTSDDFFYAAYNMHWESHSFALPKLPKNMHWERCIASWPNVAAQSLEESASVNIPGRCICLLIGREDMLGKEKKNGREKDGLESQ
ncbi:MAG: hypothetical protein J1E83_04495 [Lachnospiraceae bacterium]|nr:hypothetical protein [Lachnospiraceae bacterium]